MAVLERGSDGMGNNDEDDVKEGRDKTRNNVDVVIDKTQDLRMIMLMSGGRSDKRKNDVNRSKDVGN